MIKVEGLTKKYAGITAVKDLNFTVEKGEIVGFLGPNGAGKSTTMRILSCYLSASSGTASVAGFDVASQSREVRSRVGYMPENVALYPEMRVQEYLEYRAALKGVRGRRNRQRVNAVKELCNLRDVDQKLIGALSKGYRQRVGLADALLHDPDLLILDEPTIGLDPNQIRQVRQLIKDLGKRHTILLSTHILSEVEMTCSRVLIIDRGRIAASDTPEALAGRVRTAGGIRAEIRAGAGDLEKALAALPGVRKAEVEEMPDGWQGCVLRTDAEHDPREAVARLAAARGWALRELGREQVNLERVFAEITQSEELR
jgi:ABC-2 type transport system ATP-binding protein